MERPKSQGGPPFCKHLVGGCRTDVESGRGLPARDVEREQGLRYKQRHATCLGTEPAQVATRLHAPYTSNRIGDRVGDLARSMGEKEAGGTLS